VDSLAGIKLQSTSQWMWPSQPNYLGRAPASVMSREIVYYCADVQIGRNTDLGRPSVRSSFRLSGIRTKSRRKLFCRYRNSVCPSVCLSRPGTGLTASEIHDASGFSRFLSLVFCEEISCRLVRRFLSNEGVKERCPLTNRYFADISSSNVITVADRHRLAAYHNKHC